MRKKFCIAFLALLSFRGLSQKITILENEEAYAQRVRSAFSTVIYDNSLKELQRELLLFLEENKCEQKQESKGELYAHNVFLKNVLNKPVDVYYKFVENKEEMQVHLFAAIDIGASNYLSSERYPAESKEFISILKEFAFRVSSAPALGYLKAAQDHQVKLAKELQEFDKERVKLEGKIKLQVEKEIAAESEKKKIEQDLTVQTQKIASIKNSLEPDSIKTKAALEKRKTYETSMEELKTLQKKLEKQQTDCQRIKDKRTELEQELSKNAASISEHNKELVNQKTLEEKWKKRLAEITTD